MKTIQGVTMLYITNKSRLHTDGLYRIRSLSLDEAKQIVHDSKTFVSMVNNQVSADILTLLFETTIPYETDICQVEVGDTLLVFRAGRRITEGQTLLIDEVVSNGYKLQLITRIE